MGSEPTTTLTVAKLKALCVLNDLSASGKKAELLARLLEAGVDLMMNCINIEAAFRPQPS